jgi:hypothetical protein
VLQIGKQNYKEEFNLDDPFIVQGVDDLLSDVLDYAETELAKQFGYGFDLSCFDAISEFPNCIADPFQTDPVQRNYNKVQ